MNPCLSLCLEGEWAVSWIIKSTKVDYGSECVKETKGYWSLKEEAPGRALWRTDLGWGNGPVIRQTKERIKYLYFTVTFRHNDQVQKNTLQKTTKYDRYFLNWSKVN